MYPTDQTEKPQAEKSRAEQLRELADRLEPTTKTRVVAHRAAEESYSGYQVRRRLRELEAHIQHAAILMVYDGPTQAGQVLSEALLFIAECEELAAGNSDSEIGQ